MRKVTAFVGSAHKRNTHNAAAQYLKNLQALGEVETEIVTLSDFTLKACRGCRVCFSKGKEFCPLKDDRDLLMDKITESDGVVFASPNYCYQLSGIMKTFIDRFGFVIHRPCYFGKAFTSIVTQANAGGTKIVEYLDFVAFGLGFDTMKGICITSFDPRTEKVQQKIDRALAEHSKRFYAKLTSTSYPAPKLFNLMYFRIGRTMINRMLDEKNIDYRYYAERGWFESDYYYPTHLGLLKKAAGNLFDTMTPTLQKMFV